MNKSSEFPRTYHVEQPASCTHVSFISPDKVAPVILLLLSLRTKEGDKEGKHHRESSLRLQSSQQGGKEHNYL